jgi:hypothetical protein
LVLLPALVLRAAFGAGRTGAPGRRIWQCGQCSGPVSMVRRQSGQVMVDTRAPDILLDARPRSNCRRK